QDTRLLVLTTPIGPDALLPLAMRCTEELSHLFNFDVDIAVPVERTVSFDQILGRAVTLALQPDGVAVRHFNGIVNRFSERGRDARFTYYRARVVPKVWLLTRTRRCRIFQHLSTPEILSHVLAGFDVTYHLTATYRKRNYCVQYQESDFDFINRLMEEDGIHYFFRHTADKHTLVLADATSTSPRRPVSEPVVLRLVTDLAAEEWYVSAWEKVQEIRS